MTVTIYFIMVTFIPVFFFFQAIHNLTALGKFRKAVPGPGILGVFILRCFLRVDLYSQKLGVAADRLRILSRTIKKYIFKYLIYINLVGPDCLVFGR